MEGGEDADGGVVVDGEDRGGPLARSQRPGHDLPGVDTEGVDSRTRAGLSLDADLGHRLAGNPRAGPRRWRRSRARRPGRCPGGPGPADGGWQIAAELVVAERGGADVVGAQCEDVGHPGPQLGGDASRAVESTSPSTRGARRSPRRSGGRGWSSVVATMAKLAAGRTPCELLEEHGHHGVGEPRHQDPDGAVCWPRIRRPTGRVVAEFGRAPGDAFGGRVGDRGCRSSRTRETVDMLTPATRRRPRSVTGARLSHPVLIQPRRTGSAGVLSRGGVDRWHGSHLV